MFLDFFRLMLYYYKHSCLCAVVGRVHDTVADGWKSCMFGNAFANDMVDERLESSVAYKVFTSPFKLWNYIVKALPQLQDVIKSSMVYGFTKNLAVNAITLNTTFWGFFFVVYSIIGMALRPIISTRFYVYLVLLIIGVLLILIRRTLILHLKYSLLFRLAEGMLGGNIDLEYLTQLKGKLPVVQGAVLGAITVASGFLLKANAFAVPGFIAAVALIIFLWRYEAGVFALVFAAPFIPTMACAALALLCLVSYIIRCAVLKKSFIRMDGTSFLVMGFLAILAFFAVTSLSIKKSTEIFFIYFAFMAMYFLIVNMVTNKKRLYWICATFVTAGLFVSLFGIYQQFFGKNLQNVWIDQEMFQDISIRVYSTLENPNVLGEYLILVIPIALAMIWSCKTWLSKLYYTGVLAASSLCLVFTQSRGCWVGVMVGILVYVLFINKKYLALFFVGLLAAPFVLPASIVARFLSIGNVQDTSTSYRLYIWLGSIAMLEDFWYVGLGIGQEAFNRIYPFYSFSGVYAPHTHNIYLQLLTETSIVGLSSLLVVVLVFWRKLANVFAKGKTMVSVIAVAILSATISFMLQGAFDYVWYNYRVFLIFWITAAIGVAAIKIAKSEGGQ